VRAGAEQSGAEALGILIMRMGHGGARVLSLSTLSRARCDRDESGTLVRLAQVSIRGAQGT
jgi:hypothetical protein